MIISSDLNIKLYKYNVNLLYLTFPLSLQFLHDIEDLLHDWGVAISINGC